LKRPLLRMRAKVIHDVEPCSPDRESQLALSIGDMLNVLEQDESGWWAGHKDGSEITGWFPRTAVTSLFAPMPSSAAPLQSALATSDGRRVASPLFAGRAGASRSSKPATPNKLLEQFAVGSRQSAQPVRPSCAGGECADLPQSTLLENLAKAFEAERRFSHGLEEELQCLRALSSPEVRTSALEKAWHAPVALVQPRPQVTAASALEPKMLQTPTVRSLVAAFEGRTTPTVGNSPLTVMPTHGGSFVRASSWHA